ncbi:hypothetical protein QCD71_17935 [Sphingomonas sp. PsM26]|nr:hypothetical protein [Sphingomonas sp. PsM26]
MTSNTLKIIRLITPPLIVLILGVVFLSFFGLKIIRIPEKLEDAAFSIPTIIIALLYYITPFRSWANGAHHKHINENIRSRLVLIANLRDDPVKYSWKKVKNVFYRQIDSDGSLKKRSEDIMFNGAIWTSLADLTVISAGYSIIGLIPLFLQIRKSLLSLTVMILITVLSICLQKLVTRKHFSMGIDQLDYMEQFRRNEIISDMTKL